MPNLFDRLASQTFGINSRVMGYSAVWTPTDNSGVQNARILYKDPTETSKILKLEYNPYNYSLEYMKGDFTGLKELVDENNSDPEQIQITFNDDPLEQELFNVREVHTIIDGKCFLALLEKVV